MLWLSLMRQTTEMPYEIGTIIFARKEDITRYCQAILEKTPDGEMVEEADFCFLLELFRYHEKWTIKSGNGVSGITTKRTLQGTRCLALVRTDGKIEDISFPHTIKLIPTSRSSSRIPQGLIDYRDAARAAIQNQIRRFRDANLATPCTCPITGHLITRENVAVDHVSPLTFDRLLLQFTLSSGLRPLEVEVDTLEGTVAVFADHKITIAWEHFHKDHCCLRLLSRAGNLQLKKERLDWGAVL